MAMQAGFHLEERWRMNFACEINRLSAVWKCSPAACAQDCSSWVGKSATRTMENASVCRFLHTAVRRRLCSATGFDVEDPWGLAGITLTGNENTRGSTC